jgi:hypothetical protein
MKHLMLVVLSETVLLHPGIYLIVHIYVLTKEWQHTFLKQTKNVNIVEEANNNSSI